MMVHGRVTFCRIAAASRSAAFGSRYSLTNFTEFLFYIGHLLEVFEDALGFLFVDHADGKPDVDEYVFADLGLRCVRQADLFADAAKVYLGAAEGDIAGVDDFDDLAGNCETHEKTSAKPSFKVSRFQSFPAMTAWPSAIPPSLGGTWRCV